MATSNRFLKSQFRKTENKLHRLIFCNNYCISIRTKYAPRDILEMFPFLQLITHNELSMFNYIAEIIQLIRQ